jgi:putative transposase
VSAFVDEHRQRFGVEPICRILGVSASAYYHRATGALSKRARRDQVLLEMIREIHAANYFAYGSRRMWKALKASGVEVGRDQVARIMRQNGIHGAKRRSKPWITTVADVGRAGSPDLVERDFTAETPNRLWVADFTYLRCHQGLVFFSFVIDVFSRKVVGWQFASHMRTGLVLDALEMALSTRSPDELDLLVHHSDRGSQYTSADYTQELADAGVLSSLGSTGDAYDNALAESFVDTFKTELINDRIWRTRSQLELAIVEWVGWFNSSRLHESIGDLAPEEFERRYAANLQSAAELELN